MEADLLQAKQLLEEGGYTCVVCRGSTVYHSTHRGVKPLLQWLDSGTDMMGFSAADRVVGRGAAFLYRLLGVRRVYGQVMSMAAVKVLRAGGIEASWGSLTENIQNRQKDGLCPMEEATLALQDPEEALAAIRTRLAQLQQTQRQ